MLAGVGTAPDGGGTAMMEVGFNWFDSASLRSSPMRPICVCQSFTLEGIGIVSSLDPSLAGRGFDRLSVVF